MKNEQEKIFEAQVRHAIGQLEEILPRAVAATSAVDSVLDFLLNQRRDHAPQFTLLKESGTHYRHLAELFCPPAKAALQELLPKKRRVRGARRIRRGASSRRQN